MKIKEAVYKEVQVKQRQMVSDAIYGCDECQCEIKDFPNEESRLEVKVFHSDNGVDDLHFCSWDCILKYLPKVESDYFVTLPCLYYDAGNKSNKSASRLIELISKINQ